MSNPTGHTAWLLLAVGEDRQHAGNAGYDDQVDTYYTWDSTVPNASNIKAGDAVAFWDKRRLLGLSVVEEISTEIVTKPLFRCPVCHKASIKGRKTLTPRFRCQDCTALFEEPESELTRVTQFRSRHDAAWTDLDDALAGPELRPLCNSPGSQLSMRSLNWTAFQEALTQRGYGRAVSRALARSPKIVREMVTPVDFSFTQGHTKAMVRVRRGQRSFRDSILANFGERCAFTGPAPGRVLEAGHLYSYAQLGQHHEHGGLMLRRDVHRLFDDGSIAINPANLEIDISDSLGPFEQYARLHGGPLSVSLNDGQLGWVEKHWREHREARTSKS